VNQNTQHRRSKFIAGNPKTRFQYLTPVFIRSAHEFQARTSRIIILAYGGQSFSFHTFGPRDANRGIRVVSCPEKRASLGIGEVTMLMSSAAFPLRIGEMFSIISAQRGAMANLAYSALTTGQKTTIGVYTKQKEKIRDNESKRHGRKRPTTGKISHFSMCWILSCAFLNILHVCIFRTRATLST
jgi:hypothetical protein